MRIERIDFIAFGPFTDLSLDFTRNKGILNIVLGNNEAGKSAALRGIKAFLYGIDERTPDSFVHDNKSLRIGGQISHSEGSKLSFIRRKGRINTLLNPDGSSISEDILKRFLGNTSDELFTRLFGINHNELITGGRGIVHGQGDVGESLFAAGMGKIKLHDVIKGIEAEADELFKPRGKKKINEAIEAFNHTKNEALQNMLLSSLWTEYQEKLRGSKEERDELTLKLEDLRKRRNQLERIKNSLPAIARLKEYSSELSQMGEVVLLPPAFSDERKKLIFGLERELVIFDDTSTKLKELKDEIIKITIPDEILKHENIIIDLHQRLGSHLKAEKDSTKLQAQIEQLNANAGEILKELRNDISFADVESIRLTKNKRAKIRDIANKYAMLIANHRDKKESLETIDMDIDKLKIKLEKATKPVDISSLKGFLRDNQANLNLEDNLSQTRAKHQEELKRITLAIKRLPLWDRQLEELESIAVPAIETIDNFEQRFKDLQDEIKSITERINTTRDKINKIEIEITAINHAGYIPSEIDLANSRQWRQKGWELITSEWIRGESDKDKLKEFASEKPLHIAYEESVNRADDIADRLRREADRVAKKAHLDSEIKKIKEEKDKLSAEKENSNKQLSSLQAEWRDVWTPANINPLTPREMRAWLIAYHKLLQQSDIINTLKAEIDNLENQIQKLRAEAVNNFQSAGLLIDDKTISLKSLLKSADSYVENTEKNINEIHRLKDRLGELLGQKEKEKSRFLSLEQEISLLHPEWFASLKDLGLSDDADVSDVDAYLEGDQEFFNKIDEVKRLSKRIEDIKRDAIEFSKDVSELINRAAPELISKPPEQAVSELYFSLLKAKEDCVKLEQIKNQIKVKEEELNNTGLSIKQKKANLKILCQQAKCTEEYKLEEIENKSERARHLKEMIEQSRDHLLGYCGTRSLDEFIKEAENEDVDSVASRLKDIDDSIISYEGKLSETDRAIGEIENEIKKMSGNAKAAEANERADGILGRIKKDVERYLKLRLASSILNSEIERYRQRNQSPLLKRAGEILSRLTLNSFSTIEIAYTDNDKPVLVCVRPSGEKIEIEGMSEGSCDQLYLSLRLASLEKYINENEPLPLIVDDILVNFDDRRAESALKVLTGLSEKIQVIFFTHHKHLVEIAKDTLSKELLQIHNLEGRKTLFSA